MPEPMHLRSGEILRYTKRSADDRLVHPFRSFWALQEESERAVLLEAGINAPASSPTPQGSRLPVLLLRSSPAKAGSFTTPWHDEFRLTEGRVRYHGDHRPEKPVAVGTTSGDKRLEAAWRTHRATGQQGRLDAPPILLFRTETVVLGGRAYDKGFVRFMGLGVMTDLRVMEQFDLASGVAFENYQAELTLLDLGEKGLDWGWIEERRQHRAAEETLSLAPEAWREWIALGAAALPANTQTQPPADFLPPPARQQAAPTDVAVPPGCLSWVAARVVEHFLGGDSTHVEPFESETSSLILRGRHRLGTGEAAVSMPLKIVASQRGHQAEDIVRAQLSGRRTSDLLLVVCPEPVDLMNREPPSDKPIVLLTGDAFWRELLAVAEQSAGGDIRALLARARTRTAH